MPKHTFVCTGVRVHAHARTHAHTHTHARCSIDEELVDRRPQLRLMRPAVLTELHTQTLPFDTVVV